MKGLMTQSCTLAENFIKSKLYDKKTKGASQKQRIPVHAEECANLGLLKKPTWEEVGWQCEWMPRIALSVLLLFCDS